MILAITLAAVTSMLVIGTVALQSTQEDTDIAQMETAMAEMSSKASLAALGDSSVQQFNLGNAPAGTLEVRETAGNVTISYVKGSDIPDASNLTEIYHTHEYGAVVYTNGDREVAYQGGGVWMRTGDSGGQMISPPEYHYQAETLTFPIINVTGEASPTGHGSGTIQHDASVAQFPNSDLDNPLSNVTVYVEIQSEYHRGWYEFFDSRTAGDVAYDPGNQTVRADLTALYEGSYLGAIAVQDSIEINGQFDTDVYEKRNYPSASSEIESVIDDCNGAQNFSAHGTYGDELLCGGDEMPVASDLTFDTSDGDIRVALPEGIDLSDSDVTIQGENAVKFYSTGPIEFGNNDYNSEEDNEASQFFIYVHSDAPDIEYSANLRMQGVIYAPNSVVELGGGSGQGAGGGNFHYEGAIIADTYKASGTPAVEYSESLDDLDLGFEYLVDELRYLHITENEIEVILD